jgi:ribonuclease E
MDKTNKMLIDATHPEETRVVVLRNGRVEEFDYESASRKPLRGNIYLAKVTRVEPSLQAAFVDYGGNRHGFLAFSEIHPDYYQIPVADRQALLAEEAEADAEAEAEEDARAEAGESDAPRGRRREAPRDDQPDEPAGGEEAIAQSAAGDDRLQEPAPTHVPEAEAASAAAQPGEDSRSHGHADANGHVDSSGHANGESPAEAGNGHVEDIGSDQAEAPETVSTVEQVGSEDALEEVPERPRRRMRSYKIQEVIKRRQIILVQVVKEERGSKGAALTTYLSLAGRYTVLMPNTGRGGGISRKITQPQDRKRLKAIAHELEVPEGMGLIIRTAGAARTKQEIKRDFEYEIRLWENVRDLTLTSTAPCLVYEEGNLIKRSIRDLYSKDIDDIVVAGETAYKEAHDFMGMLSPGQVKSVVKHDAAEPLFARYQIERQLNAMFSPYVTLRSGGYLVINQTEALVSIDVNSGKATREFSIEETALNTNLEASDEIARQLKLRDLAGLIVIDFIDMEERRNNRKVENRLKDALRHDRARIQVGRISHFGLLEMSRQRLRTGVLEGSTTQCPHCQGTGIIRSVESVALAVLRALEDQLLRDPRSSLTAVTTADAALYILNNKRAFVTDMERRYGVVIAVQASERMQGANFAIERSATQSVPQRSAERAVVNIESGFERQEGEEDVREDAEEPAERGGGESEGGGRRGRRRRRRGRRDDRGGEERYAHRDQRGGERAHNGNVEDVGSEPAEFSEHPESGDEPADEPAGFGEQPPVSRSENGHEDRPGRRRRRGRRGGRRGRDDAPREHAAHHEGDDVAAHEGASGNGGSEPEAGRFAETAHHHEERPAAEAAPERTRGESEEPRHTEPERESASRRSWQAPAERYLVGEPEATRHPEPAVLAESPPAREPEPVSAQPAAEPAPEEPARPARKGWWQRKFSGE